VIIIIFFYLNDIIEVWFARKNFTSDEEVISAVF